MSYQDLNCDLSDLADFLEKYSTDVMEDIESEYNKIANQALKDLKNNSPYDPKHSGKHYREGWKKNRSKNRSKYIYGVRITLLSKGKPHLTHLLENGHIAANGKRVGKREHIAPVQQEVNRKLNELNIQRIVERHNK